MTWGGAWNASAEHCQPCANFTPSDDGYGTPMVSGRYPDVTYKFLQREKQRFYACLFAPVAG